MRESGNRKWNGRKFKEASIKKKIRGTRKISGVRGKKILISGTEDSSRKKKTSLGKSGTTRSSGPRRKTLG